MVELSADQLSGSSKKRTIRELFRVSNTTNIKKINANWALCNYAIWVQKCVEREGVTWHKQSSSLAKNSMTWPSLERLVYPGNTTGSNITSTTFRNTRQKANTKRHQICCVRPQQVKQSFLLLTSAERRLISLQSNPNPEYKIRHTLAFGNGGRASGGRSAPTLPTVCERKAAVSIQNPAP